MNEERQRVLSTYRQLLEAWNDRDADAFAALFAADGSSVGFDGSQMNGRAEIAETLRTIFADHQTATYVARVREIRPLAGGVMLLRAVVGMIPPGQAELNPKTNAVQSLVVVTDGDRPRIELLHNTPAAFHKRPEAVDALTRELSAVAGAGRVLEPGG
jgi:uncharacterized protein (TIGR02246 family)